MFPAFILSSFLLGFLGSFHCVGMCGPIALSLPVQHLQGLHKLRGILIYNAGRTFTYFTAGIFFGVIGMSLRFFASQQFLSILLGSLLLAAFIASLFRKKIFQHSFIQKNWNRYISGMIVPLFHRQNTTSLLLIGMLNGLLPCGLVYMAVAGALATGNILYSGLFMACFGLGTMPAMIAVSFTGGFVSMRLRNTCKKSFPFIMGIMGVLLILRGLNLGIPFISPVASHATAVHCH